MSGFLFLFQRSRPFGLSGQKSFGTRVSRPGIKGVGIKGVRFLFQV